MRATMKRVGNLVELPVEAGRVLINPADVSSVEPHLGEPGWSVVHMKGHPPGHGFEVPVSVVQVGIHLSSGSDVCWHRSPTLADFDEYQAGHAASDS